MVKDIDTNTINEPKKSSGNKLVKNVLIQYINRVIKYYEEIVNNQKKSNSKEKIILKELKLYLGNNK